jgi:5-methylcytosine-specific restriction endonuclease McrA
VESERKCIYCGAGGDLQREHIVPRSVKVSLECKTCEKIQGIHNQVWACQQCNYSKGTMGLYEFYKKKYPDDKKFYDFIPSLLEKKYLKTIYNCHECAQTLDERDLDGDGKMTVLDIDFILH